LRLPFSDLHRNAMKKHSLVLVTVDCLRADHTGFLGYSRPVTPNLDFLAENSVVFTNAIVAGAPTYFSFPAILASRYPLSLGRDILGIAPNESTITTVLQKAGYRTAAFLAGNPYLSQRFGYHVGFDTFHDFLGSVPSEEPALPLSAEKKCPSDFNRFVQAASRRTRLTAGIYDELYFWYCQWRSARENLSMAALRRYPAADVIVDRACSWLSGLGDQPFFLWIHMMDPHYPHYPPPEALSGLGVSNITARRARFLNSVWSGGDTQLRRLQWYRKDILSLYDAGVYWVDKQVSRLVSSLRESRRWDETVFVLTADHGEEFLDHGGRYHSPLNLSEELIHVPLMVRAPQLSNMRKVQRPFSLIDLAPTLLEGVEAEVPRSFQGRSYWGQMANGADWQGGPSIAESVGTGRNPLRVEERMRPGQMTVRDEIYKLVIHFGEKVDRMYDLRNDPGEQSPMPAGASTSERALLLRVAHTHLQRTRHNRDADLVLRARLRELGQSVNGPGSCVP
jgi:arylsulfatase A-like enzyme